MRCLAPLLLAVAACTGGSTAGMDAGPVDAGTDGGAPGTRVMPFAEETDSQDLVVDGSGGVHVAAHAYGRATDNILYARGAASGFQTVVLGSVTSGGAELVLRVTPDGKPRLLQPGISGGGDGFDYWTCDSACTTAASWSHVRVRDDNARVTGPFEHEYFAVGPSGQAAFVYLSSAGTNVATCTGTCSTAAGWKTGVLTLNAFADIQLRFDSTGLMHLAAVDVSNPGAFHPVYLQCASACEVGTNWKGLTFANAGNAPLISLALAGDAPRLAAWYDDVGNATLNQKMAIFACDASCTTAAGWRNFFLVWPDKTSARLERRTKLVIDGATSTIVTRGASKIVSAKCTKDCGVEAGNWTPATLNTADAMRAEFPKLPPCSSALWVFASGMTAGAAPNGSLVLGYGAHARGLSANDAGTCSAGTDYGYQTVVQVLP